MAGEEEATRQWMGLIAKEWWTSGSIFKDRMVCQYAKAGSPYPGIWYGYNPLDNPTSLLMLQLVLIFIFNHTVYCVLYPLRQNMIVAQIVAGIIMGPSFLSHDRKTSNKMFPPPGRYILHTISNFGFMLHLFILGVKIDMTSVRSSGAKSIIIGFSGLLLSILFGSFTFVMVRQWTYLDQTQFSGIRMLIFFNSLTFFIVTNSYLHDLKLSNSDMGRLASSSSLVVDAFGLLSTLFLLVWSSPTKAAAPHEIRPPAWMSLIPIGFYYLVLFCIFRPLVLYILKRNPPNPASSSVSMKQTHFLLILIILLIAWLWGEQVGQKLAPFIFGLSLPDGPPLGSVLVQKLEIFTSGILFPAFCTMTGWRTNLHSLKSSTTSTSSSSIWAIELIFIIGHLGKLLGTILSSIFLGVSLKNAIPLGFMMSFKGIMEIAIFSAWKDNAVLDDQLFSLCMINIVLFTGVAFPLAQHMYDPWTKYKTMRKRRTDLENMDGDLPILVCIHNEEIVPTIINLLELLVSKTNRGRSGSISVLALQLIQLRGSAMPILMPLHKSPTNYRKNNRTANALQLFEKQRQGFARVQHFISVAPYKTMHNDICALAHDQRINIIILPFHKQWGVDGNIETTSPRIREINIRVLRNSPCSVALLIDKSSRIGSSFCCNLSKAVAATAGASPISSYPNPHSQIVVLNVVMLFIGGADDREALALASRMAEHSNVKLTVTWLKSIYNNYDQQLIMDSQQDIKMMIDFHTKSKRHEGIELRETTVPDGIGTTKVILALQHADLFIVGRYHEPNCPAVQGLLDWSESSELGALGDLLATPDFLSSILVVQQQPRIDWHINHSRHSSRGDDTFNLDIFEDESSHQRISTSQKL